MDETNATTTETQVEDQTVETTETATQEPKTYTQAELDELLKGYKSKEEVENLIQSRVAREKATQEKAVAEAEKLAKMDANEKAEYESEQQLKRFADMQKKLEELEHQNNYNAMSKQAATMLSKEKVAVNDAVLSMVVVADNAGQTQANIKAFAELVKDGVTAGVKEALKGETLKAQPQQVSKESGYKARHAEALKARDAGEAIRIKQEAYSEGIIIN